MPALSSIAKITDLPLTVIAIRIVRAMVRHLDGRVASREHGLAERGALLVPIRGSEGEVQELGGS